MYEPAVMTSPCLSLTLHSPSIPFVIDSRYLDWALVENSDVMATPRHLLLPCVAIISF